MSGRRTTARAARAAGLAVAAAAATALTALPGTADARTEELGAPPAVTAAAQGGLVEVGPDDVRLSAMGVGGQGWGTRPAVAGGPASGELLVVWEGDDPGGPLGLADDEREIWGQRVDGGTLLPVGPRLRISAMGPDGDPAFDAARPAVAWSPAQGGQWLVVWEGDGGPGTGDGEVEIWARAVTADGTLVGTDAQRISTMGSAGDVRASAHTPAVAGGPDGFLVAWSGEDLGPLADDELEIWARAVGPTGTPAGDEQRVSTMGPDGTAAFAALEPAVAPAAGGGWVVVWWGDDDRPGMVDDEFEVFARRLSPTGAPLGGDDVRLSHTGPPGGTGTFAQSPDVATDPATGEHLVVWLASDGVEREIEAVRLTPELAVATGPERISSMDGPAATPFDPAVAFQPAAGEWLVTWWGDEAVAPLVDNEYEVWARRVSRGGVALGDDVRVSDMGSPGGRVAAARHPAVAAVGSPGSPAGGRALVVWAGNDADVVEEVDTEVYAQLLGQAVPTSTRFVPLVPARLLDTREGLGAPAERLDPQQTIDLQVTGRGGVPASGVAAVALNVTLADATDRGFVTVWPAGRVRPLASSLNVSAPGRDRANLVVVPVGEGGRVSLVTQSGGHLVADVTGWFAPESFSRAGRLVPVGPARVLDTRDGTGVPPGRLAADRELEVQVAGRGGVPPVGAAGVVANLTLTEATAPGFVTAWPSGQVRPLASTLNAAEAGDVVPNLVMLPLGADGRIRLYTQSGGHLLLDVVGWFTDESAPESAGGLFTPLPPERVLDTRTGTGTATGILRAGDVLALRIPGRAGVPERDVAAVVANLTVAESTAAGFLTAWPSGAPRPNASNVNATGPGQDVANLAVVGLSELGVASFYSQSGGHLVADVAGWFAS